MDPYEMAMLNFAITWSPFSDADEQIFPEFGISAPAFYSRVLELVMSRRTVLDNEIRTHLRAVCMDKLSKYSRPPTPGRR
ncbi:hypothetical protein R1CP_36865 (plasmid) [Rhodococcus opacus]|uniref:DUF3263 domain-containing protein n=1 Tax=Rhodococcus opacus TaxID=37919 RepID=A0A1B1KHA5_RHOOP|nr:hypothetical protein [Rhodococcus opacus]ANS31978.1 hypothetical protein R1CP_36860 [Rhodococcus opacus]ANS31979.1 hypothetical protein R1CP_36865 [Rhodococcus opacus]